MKLDLLSSQPNKSFLKKIPVGSEVANIMVGGVDFLKKPIVVFVRLGQATTLADLTEVDLPTRFIFMVLGPGDFSELGEQGRAAGSLFSDKVFGSVAFRAMSSQDVLDGIDEYMDDLTVLPPSVWDPSIRLEPPQTVVSMDKIRKRLNPETRAKMEEIELHAEMDDPSLKRTGRLFGGLIGDIKRRYPYYMSDIKDAIHMQTIASVFFMFFACITPIVTFGGLMGDKTDQYMGVMECIVSGAICGLLYALFSGQPLTIVGATGPLLIFESIVYQLCKSNDWDFLSFRFWIGMWCCFILLIIVMFDLSALVRYITRFTEESFSVLISVIFTYEAFHKVIHIWHTHPMETGVLKKDTDYICLCVPDNKTVVNAVVAVQPGCLTKDVCYEHGWATEGPACDDHNVVENIPNVFLLSCFLFLGTFGIAYSLRCFRNMPYFPSIIRQSFADFAVLIAIIICTGVDIGMALPTPKLTVPNKFEPTNTAVRGWVVNPFGMQSSQWWLAILAAVPAILATILIFLDQQITAVIVNRREHKLKKPHGYHLDLFVLIFLIGIASLLGLPWFVAATVRALTHVKSLFKESEVKIPGEKPYHLGVREQRVTGICIHILIACSIFLTNILKFIPMPVLYGVFLYMGITSLSGVQFVDRILLLVMPAKYQPDFAYLRHVRTNRVHLFTVIQLVCFIGMWVVKTTKTTAIAFPLMLLVLCGVRKLMDFMFTQSELYWLDHLFPEAMRRMKEDEAKNEDNGVTYGDEEMVKLKSYEPSSPSSKALLDEDTELSKQQ
ncbi:hypothetical protein CAPTEDRAFT_177933 [Capitella teleta]|uniref:Anion exchange protein n=1 Tax=Capitella teleta TaxID=283909 RepID=R7UFQ2_CAPTE|nr:hypothetical protein CAPTEDRAFT_177933 [Capitella teleta]|eukprot:ELU05030.1 hypothetical protein CAPTEDRAFT_177933 [Capitella teleta]